MWFVMGLGFGQCLYMSDIEVSLLINFEFGISLSWLVFMCMIFSCWFDCMHVYMYKYLGLWLLLLIGLFVVWIWLSFGYGLAGSRVAGVV